MSRVSVGEVDKIVGAASGVGLSTEARLVRAGEGSKLVFDVDPDGPLTSAWLVLLL